MESDKVALQQAACCLLGWFLALSSLLLWLLDTVLWAIPGLIVVALICWYRAGD